MVASHHLEGFEVLLNHSRCLKPYFEEVVQAALQATGPRLVREQMSRLVR